MNTNQEIVDRLSVLADEAEDKEIPSDDEGINREAVRRQGYVTGLRTAILTLEDPSLIPCLASSVTYGNIQCQRKKHTGRHFHLKLYGWVDPPAARAKNRKPAGGT